MLFKGVLHPSCELLTPNQKLACFVLYLKIINTFLKNNESLLFKELKNGIEILVDQVVLKNHLAYLNINVIFEFFEHFTIKHRPIPFFKNVLKILGKSTKHANFWLGVNSSQLAKMKKYIPYC